MRNKISSRIHLPVFLVFFVRYFYSIMRRIKKALSALGFIAWVIIYLRIDDPRRGYRHRDSLRATNDKASHNVRGTAGNFDIYNTLSVSEMRRASSPRKEVAHLPLAPPPDPCAPFPRRILRPHRSPSATRVVPRFGNEGSKGETVAACRISRTHLQDGVLPTYPSTFSPRARATRKLSLSHALSLSLSLSLSLARAAKGRPLSPFVRPSRLPSRGYRLQRLWEEALGHSSLRPALLRVRSFALSFPPALSFASTTKRAQSARTERARLSCD